MWCCFSFSWWKCFREAKSRLKVSAIELLGASGLLLLMMMMVLVMMMNRRSKWWKEAAYREKVLCSLSLSLWELSPATQDFLFSSVADDVAEINWCGGGSGTFSKNTHSLKTVPALFCLENCLYSRAQSQQQQQKGHLSHSLTHSIGCRLSGNQIVCVSSGEKTPPPILKVCGQRRRQILSASALYLIH